MRESRHGLEASRKAFAGSRQHGARFVDCFAGEEESLDELEVAALWPGTCARLSWYVSFGQYPGLVPRCILRRVIADKKSGWLLLFVLLTTAATAQPKVERVLVLKRQHKLLLLSGDQVVKAYEVALGRGGLGPKQRQGDRRTPEGLYTIDFHNKASKFHLALHISYPQFADKRRARRIGVKPGGDVMIHGMGPEFSWVGANHRVSDWTDGCIAVTDTEIEEIWQLVPDGTPVEIRP